MRIVYIFISNRYYEY